MSAERINGMPECPFKLILTIREIRRLDELTTAGERYGKAKAVGAPFTEIELWAVDLGARAAAWRDGDL